MTSEQREKGLRLGFMWMPSRSRVRVRVWVAYLHGAGAWHQRDGEEDERRQQHLPDRRRQMRSTGGGHRAVREKAGGRREYER
jgi:hypothetical protein